MGLAVLGVLAVTCRYTASLLGEITRAHPEASEYASMAAEAFGWAGTMVMASIFAFELLVAAGASYTVLGADSLAALFPSSPIGVVGFAFVFLAVVFPTLVIPDLSYLGGISFVGVLSSILAVAAVVFTGVTHDGEPGGIVPPALTQIARPRGLPFVMGLFMVGFAGHACFPSIRASMRDPSQYETMLNLTFASTLTVYAGTAAVGYLMYGLHIDPEITLNLPQGSPVTQATLWLIVVNVWSKFAISIEPVADVAEGLMSWLVERCAGRPCAAWLFGEDSLSHPPAAAAAEGAGAGPRAAPVTPPHRITGSDGRRNGAAGEGSVTPDLMMSGMPPLARPSPSPVRQHRPDGSSASHVARAHGRFQARAARRDGRHGALPSSASASAVGGPGATRDGVAVGDRTGLLGGVTTLGSELGEALPATPSWAGGRLHMVTPRRAVPAALLASRGRGETCMQRPCCCGVTRHEWLKRTLVRLLLASIALVVAVSVPQFQTILAFAGSVASFTVSVAAPPAFYVVLFGDKLSFGSKAFHWGLAAAGMVCALAGTVGSVLGPM